MHSYREFKRKILSESSGAAAAPTPKPQHAAAPTSAAPKTDPNQLKAAIGKEVDTMFARLKMFVQQYTLPQTGSMLDRLRKLWWDLRFNRDDPSHPLHGATWNNPYEQTVLTVQQHKLINEFMLEVVNLNEVNLDAILTTITNLGSELKNNIFATIDNVAASADEDEVAQTAPAATPAARAAAAPASAPQKDLSGSTPTSTDADPEEESPPGAPAEDPMKEPPFAEPLAPDVPERQWDDDGNILLNYKDGRQEKLFLHRVKDPAHGYTLAAYDSENPDENARERLVMAHHPKAGKINPKTGKPYPSVTHKRFRSHFYTDQWSGGINPKDHYPWLLKYNDPLRTWLEKKDKATLAHLDAEGRVEKETDKSNGNEKANILRIASIMKKYGIPLTQPDPAKEPGIVQRIRATRIKNRWTEQLLLKTLAPLFAKGRSPAGDRTPQTIAAATPEPASPPTPQHHSPETEMPKPPIAPPAVAKPTDDELPLPPNEPTEMPPKKEPEAPKAELTDDDKKVLHNFRELPDKGFIVKNLLKTHPHLAGEDGDIDGEKLIHFLKTDKEWNFWYDDLLNPEVSDKKTEEDFKKIEKGF